MKWFKGKKDICYLPGSIAIKIEQDNNSWIWSKISVDDAFEKGTIHSKKSKSNQQKDF